MRWTLALLAWAAPWIALAQNPALPGETYWSAARFRDNPTAVTVDVVEVGGSQLADDASATQQTIDSDDSDVWRIDLSTVTGFAPDCDQRTYIVRFVPDSADCSDDGTPDLCPENIVRSGGAFCKANTSQQVDYVYASTTISAQGITQGVRMFYNRQGQEPIKWRRILIANDEDFTSPDETVYQVYFYSETLGFPHIRCTVFTTSDPAVSLPSAGSCLP